MRLEPSDELRVMVRPFATYRLLAEGVSFAPWWWRSLLTLVVLGAFVSVTTAGRFVAAHLVLVALAWAFLPATQLTWLWVVRQRWGMHRPFGFAVHLFFAGHGGWFLVLIGMIALVTLAPGVADQLDAGGWIAVFGVGVVLALVHGFVVTYAFVREVWGESARQAILATSSYYLGLALTYIAYYLTMGQLLPIIGRTQ